MCVMHMQNKEGKTEEEAKAICGKLQAEAEGAAKPEPNHMNEPANPAPVPVIRELRREVVLKPDKIQEQDGGVLVKDVTLLGTGTWTDSGVGTPLFYPESTLKEYAGNWVDNSLWSRHAGRVPRSITDKIGEIRNPHYNNGAVIGDLWLHGKTQASRDTTELIKAGLVNWVSVEHGGAEEYNPSTGRNEAKSLIFGGVAVVNRGACTICTINNGGNESTGTNLVQSELDTVDKIDKELIKELQCAESDLPASSYAWVEDKEKKTTWHLPHHSMDGKIKCECVRAALQAIGGARTGKPMEVPASAVSHLKSHAKECEINTETERKQSEQDKQSALAEAKAMELKELEGQLAEAIKTIGELRDASAKKDVELAELKKGGESTAKQLENANTKLAELEKRIEKIEKTPAPATQIVLEKELEMPPTVVRVNKKTGEVYGA